jgi:hypothetical protein
VIKKSIKTNLTQRRKDAKKDKIEQEATEIADQVTINLTVFPPPLPQLPPVQNSFDQITFAP